MRYLLNMNARTKHVLAEALELGSEERATLADALLASLYVESNPDAEHAWARVIERRAQEVLAGEVTGPECGPFLADLIDRLEQER